MENLSNNQTEAQLLRKISMLENMLEILFEEPVLIEHFQQFMHPKNMSIKTDALLLNVERSLN